MKNKHWKIWILTWLMMIVSGCASHASLERHVDLEEKASFEPKTLVWVACTETDGQGNTLTKYVWLDNIPIAHIEKGQQTDQITLLITDHLGTPRVGMDHNQTITWRWTGDVFGSSFADSDADNNGNKTTINLRFPGQYYDIESGLHYNWHRYYDPITGRYITSDPIGLKGGINTFGYVGGNPLMYSDPTGLYQLPSWGGFQLPSFDPGSTSVSRGGTPVCRGVWRQVETIIHPFHPAARIGACACGYICSSCDGQNIYKINASGNIIPTLWKQGFASADPNDPESPGMCNCRRPTHETGCIDCD